uniref:adenosine deaminase n=1 Tax=Candidatus Kentrum sp. FM TaxID=2126340 RepID=A0A450RVT6_9GAMM|nr:MAG: adenosine deaminase [Candidatus Kentron sp. FM]VFJ43973.1 MAG: adenosine deaminase [Candidatus Kentron sp. FM]VFK06010.1 MAG: adenosine deaminase [Candidatus Kentron sp. FM]
MTGAPECPGPAAPGFFFICAWNAWDRERNGWRAGLEDGKVVCDYLERRGWEETEDEEQADLIAVLPRDKDKALSLADLMVYSRGMGGKPKQILYLHTAARAKFIEGAVAPWLFVGSRAGCPFEEIGGWLGKNSELGQSISASWFGPAKEELARTRNLLAALESGDPGDNQSVNSDEKWTLSRTGERLIEEERESSPSKFFYGLCRIGDRYNKLEHDINARKARESGNSSPTARAKDAAQMELLDRYADLRSAIATRCSIIPPSPPNPNVILLIDDNPERGNLAVNIDRYIREYLPEFELWVWNPDIPTNSNSGGLLYRRDVERYASWGRISKDFPEKCVGIQKVIFPTPSPRQGLPRTSATDGKNDNPSLKHTDPAPLGWLLAHTHTVLVDILFEDVTGGNVEAGFGIVSGIQRICRDYRKEITGELALSKPDRDGEETKWTQPEVIALSRASDLDKVQTVFRRGGGGYVKKDRLLSLPAMIARGHLPVSSAGAEAHRNFRQLYNLPHETIGLLRAVKLPTGLSFHRSSDEGSTTPECEERTNASQPEGNGETEWARHQPLAKLIAALPKADLHVHPGSCMSPEFLAIASLVMLARRKLKGSDDSLSNFRRAIRALSRFWAGEGPLSLFGIPVVGGRRDILLWEFWSDAPDSVEKGSPTQVERVAEWMRGFLLEQIRNGECNRRIGLDKNHEIEACYLEFRSILHKELKLPDYQDPDAIADSLRGKPAATLFFFALRHAGPEPDGEPVLDDKDDLLRLFILWLMAGDGDNRPKTEIKLSCEGESEITIDLEQWFRRGEIDETIWNRLHEQFYGKRSKTDHHSTESLRGNHWELNSRYPCELSFSEQGGRANTEDDLLSDSPTQQKNPLAWLMASGSRATNLKEYLEGCEYTGAEHLKHPFLIHLFAQQTVHTFVRHGVLYAELRAAIGGYENDDLRFSFADACDCFRAAFGSAQRMVHRQYRGSRSWSRAEGSPGSASNTWLWKDNFPLPALFDPLESELATHRFPCKASVILTGKRHKSTRTIVREAAAGAVLFSRPLKDQRTAGEFAEKAMGECRIVGFDLAGQEDGYPPEQFREDYEPLAKLHIPVTVHAGENAPARFVERAILDLRARRLGHGLALADDKQLMHRARDDGICVELCPVSNFQTNAVFPHGKKEHGRIYPLREFLKEGIAVTLDTDNPVISDTNPIKECFQASHAFGDPGLSLWELLRILRLGFSRAFLTLHERRALLELADQLLLDLFSEPEIVRLLQLLTTCNRLSVRG